MAQITVNGFIRAADPLDPSLEYCTHHSAQSFWQNILSMCIYGGPRPASGPTGRDLTAEECENQEFPANLVTHKQRFRYTACRTWYLLWQDRTLGLVKVSENTDLAAQSDAFAELANIDYGKYKTMGREKFPPALREKLNCIV